jgi:excisionase family DNA binding protein
MPTTTDDRLYITTPQAEARTGYSKTYLTRLLRNGTLEGFRLGRDWLIFTDSLEQFLSVPHKPGPKGPRKKSAEDHSRTLESDLTRTKSSGER